MNRPVVSFQCQVEEHAVLEAAGVEGGHFFYFFKSVDECVSVNIQYFCCFADIHVVFTVYYKEIGQLTKMLMFHKCIYTELYCFTVVFRNI